MKSLLGGRERGLTIHITGCHGLRVGEGIHDEGEQGPHEQYDVGEETEGAHPERAMGDVVATAEEEANDRDGVAQVEEDDARGDHTAGTFVICNLFSRGLERGAGRGILTS